MGDARIELDDLLAPSSPGATAAAPAPSPSAAVSPALASTWVGIIVIGAALNAEVMRRFVPTLAMLYADAGLSLDRTLQLYIASNSYAAVVLIVLGFLTLVAVVTGRRVPALSRPWLLAFIVASGVWTIGGLYVAGYHALLHAMRLHIGMRGVQIERDLAALYLLTGQPNEAVRVIDPNGARSAFAGGSYSAGAVAFQLGEAYRLAGDLDTARQLYSRAQGQATTFDERLSEQIVREQEGLQRAGVDFKDWALQIRDVRRLPDVVRTAAQERLNQIGR